MSAIYPVLTYSSILIAIIILAFLVSHYREFTYINPELRIQQTEHPDNDTIYTLIRRKLPTLFLYDVELWDGFDLMIGYPYDDIKEVLKDNNKLIKQLKKLYLAPFAAPLTRDWLIELKRTNTVWNSIPNDMQAVEETCYGGHYIASFSGLLCICLINPSVDNKHYLQQPERKPINKTRTAKFFIDTAALSKEDIAAQKLDTNVYDTNGNIINIKSETNDDNTPNTICEFEYITIPVRPSHMIFIPYGWYYYIYCGQDNSYACYMDIKNQTWI